MIAGDSEERLLRYRWREQRGYATEQIPPFQRRQGALWWSVAVVIPEYQALSTNQGE
jgi:hypothetical protein